MASPVGILQGSVLLANDRDAAGDALSIISIDNVEGGAAVTLEPDGTIRIVTADGYQGLVDFRYTIADPSGGTSSATATVDVVPNIAPVALGSVPDYTSAENAPVDFTLPAGIFSDADDDWLHVSATLADGVPLPAWLAFDRFTGHFTGTPPTDFIGALVIRVEVTDGLASASHQFNLTIAAQNYAPIAAADDGFSTPAGTALSIAASALLDNDSDINGDALTIQSVGNAIGGTVALQPDGSVLFMPATNFTGPAEFTYTVDDGAGGEATATVSLTVTVVPGATLGGTSGNDNLVGGLGDDVFLLIGDGGLDTIDGGGGIDTVRGSDYNDIVRLVANPANFTSIEVIDGGGGNDRILGGAGNDTIDASPFQLMSIELIDGGAGDDTIIGSAGNDTIMGNTGNDTLSGGLGDDVFALAGDGGLDTIDGGDGIDTVRGSIYNDNIRISTGAASLTSIEIIDGGAGNDRILGGAGDDVIDLSGTTLLSIELIDGGAGNDTIVGSGGDDVISGNSGNDMLIGGLGNDTFTFVGDTGFDTIHGGAGSDTLQGSGYNDIIRISTGVSGISGIETIAGGAGNDRILGGAGDDVIDLGGISLSSVELIDGGTGNDTIIGSLSDDRITGGAGSDMFVFAPGGGHDSITDFRAHALGGSGLDVIDLSAFDFATFAELFAAAWADGSDTVIEIDAANSIRLVGGNIEALGSDDFII